MKTLEKKFAEVFYGSLVRGVTSISSDILNLMMEARENESSQGRSMLEAMIKNVELAQKLKKGYASLPEFPASMCAAVRRWEESI
jgi:tartrate dehydratase alpha subunit/fumarate hydratase class I-like protein